MARTLDPRGHAVRRDAIVDVAERLIRTRGYEQMSIQDVQDELGVSRGAIYHYFRSKAALLDAVLERAADALIATVTPIAADPELSALTRLQAVFDAGGRWKAERKDLMLALLPAWYSADNAVVREQLRRVVLARMAPLLASVVRQGAREGAFRVTSPEHVAGVLVTLLEGSGDAVSHLLLARLAGAVPFEEVEGTVQAYDEAIERILGLPPRSFRLIDTPTLRFWFA